MADENRLNLVALKSCLLSPSVNQPVVFHGLISSWPAMQWSPMQLTNIFTDQTFKFRLGRKYSDGKQCHQCFSRMNSFLGGSMKVYTVSLFLSINSLSEICALPPGPLSHHCLSCAKNYMQLFATSCVNSTIVQSYINHC